MFHFKEDGPIQQARIIINISVSREMIGFQGLANCLCVTYDSVSLHKGYIDYIGGVAASSHYCKYFSFKENNWISRTSKSSCYICVYIIT